MYRLIIRKQAIKALQGMLARDSSRIRRLLDTLAEDPDRRGIGVKPLRGRQGFRMRVGAHRVAVTDPFCPKLPIHSPDAS